MMTADEVLQGATVDRNVVRITSQSLDRPVYEQVKKALEDIGGKWKGGNIKGFVFQTDPTELVEKLKGGEKVNLAKDYQFFWTSDKWADHLVKLAEIQDGMCVLEPSAGQGAIINAIFRAFPRDMTGPNDKPAVTVDYYELMPMNQEILGKIANKNRTSCMGDDFLLCEDDYRYERIVANPPFGKNQDIDHIYNMYRVLRPGGRMVTFCSRHYENSSNKKEKEFAKWLKDVNAIREEVPIKAFERAGTSIASYIFVINRPK